MSTKSGGTLVTQTTSVRFPCANEFVVKPWERQTHTSIEWSILLSIVQNIYLPSKRDIHVDSLITIQSQLQ